MPAARLPDFRFGRQANVDDILKFSYSFIYKIESYMSPRCVIFTAVAACLGIARQLERFAGNMHFRHGTDSCNPLYHMAIAIAAGKIHPAVDAARIFP